MMSINYSPLLTQIIPEQLFSLIDKLGSMAGQSAEDGVKKALEKSKQGPFGVSLPIKPLVKELIKPTIPPIIEQGLNTMVSEIIKASKSNITIDDILIPIKTKDGKDGERLIKITEYFKIKSDSLEESIGDALGELAQKGNIADGSVKRTVEEAVSSTINPILRTVINKDNKRKKHASSTC